MGQASLIEGLFVLSVLIWCLLCYIKPLTQYQFCGAHVDAFHVSIPKASDERADFELKMVCLPCARGLAF